MSPPVVTSERAGRGGPGLVRVLERLLSSPPVDAATAKQIRAKQAAPLFVGTGRIGVMATRAGRARSLLRRVVAALHTANAPGTHLYRSWRPNWVVREWLSARSAPLVRQPCLINADELAGLVA